MFAHRLIQSSKGVPVKLITLQRVSLISRSYAVGARRSRFAKPSNETPAESTPVTKQHPVETKKEVNAKLYPSPATAKKIQNANGSSSSNNNRSQGVTKRNPHKSKPDQNQKPSSQPSEKSNNSNAQVKTNERQESGRRFTFNVDKKTDRKERNGTNNDNYNNTSNNKNENSKSTTSNQSSTQQYKKLKTPPPPPPPVQKIEQTRPKIDIPSFISVANFATILRVRVPQLLANLTEFGFENITNEYILDFETASLIAGEYGFEVTVDDELGADLFPAVESPDEPNSKPRAPIVTIMGHVDHGKTTILDFLRKSSIVKGEHGGITQHIGAFSVKTPVSKKSITFLDTPGHAAFLKMRERGANITDVVVLVVAAEDSVMPQTVEAIKHAKNAGVPVVVAINKCDKEEANPDKVVADLSARGIDVEDYGGEVPTVRISAKTGMSMDELEETIITVSDMLELKAPEKSVPVEGWILESQVKKGLGKVATFLVKRGQLKPGSILVAGTTWCKVKIMRDETGKAIKVAGPATPVEVSGWKEVPEAGELTIQAPNEAFAKKVIRNREKRYRLLEEATLIEDINKKKIEQIEKAQRDDKIQEYQRAGLTIDEIKELEPELFEDEGSKCQTVPFIVKADVSGSSEAVSQSIEGLGNDEIKSHVLFHSVGPPTESDIERAKMAGANILAFNIKVPQEIKNSASAAGIEVKEFNVIYHLIENVLETLTDKLPTLLEIKTISKVEVRKIFNISKGKSTFNIAGSKVIDGVFKRKASVRIMREGEEVYRGSVKQLKIEKDDADQAKNGVECGIALEGDPELLPGDIIESFEEVKVKRHL